MWQNDILCVRDVGVESRTLDEDDWRTIWVGSSGSHSGATMDERYGIGDGKTGPEVSSL